MPANLLVPSFRPLFSREQAAVRQFGLSKPPDSFVVGVLKPFEVDFLDLNTLKRHKWIQRWVKGEEPGEDGAAEAGGWSEVSGYAPPVVSTVM